MQTVVRHITKIRENREWQENQNIHTYLKNQ